MKNNKVNNIIVPLFLSTIGTAFLIYYIFRGSLDVIASDYIRIVNYYIDDVTNLDYLLSWEGISRIPFAFLARYINVKLFQYSVHFDRILGIFGLFIFNFVVVKYVMENIVSKVFKSIIAVVCTYISFSLMSWEMILNGTGYAHFIFTGLAVLTFYKGADILDAERKTSNANIEFLKICMLIITTSLLFAGSYSVGYLCTIIFISMIVIAYVIIKKYHGKQDDSKSLSHTSDLRELKYRMGKSSKQWYRMGELYEPLIIIVISVICLLCYFKSSNTGKILIPVGVKDITLLELIKTKALFPIKFLIKSLASSIIGVETFDYALNFKTISEKMIYIVGIVYLLIIIFAFIILIKRVLSSFTKTYIFPAIMFVYGAANYILVFLARYNFVRDDYGMSSRYSIQYMFLTIAVVLVLSKFVDDSIMNCKVIKDKVTKNAKEVKSNKPYIVKLKAFVPQIICVLSIFFIMLGHITTTTDEIFKADYRIYAYRELEEKAQDYINLSDEELENLFEYRRDADHIKAALMTLQYQKLNIFKY